MTAKEFSDRFDVLYNNISNNEAPGLNEYEKSVFLTKAQDEILKNYFNEDGNKYKQGFDGNTKRQIDFSKLMRTTTLYDLEWQRNHKMLSGSSDSTKESYYYKDSNGEYFYLLRDSSYKNDSSFDQDKHFHCYNDGLQASEYLFPEVLKSFSTYDPRSFVFIFPKDMFLFINEQILIKDTDGNVKAIRQVQPIKYDQYNNLMSKPFKEPLKYQAWRFITSSNDTNGTYAEILVTSKDIKNWRTTVHLDKPAENDEDLIRIALGNGATKPSDAVEISGSSAYIISLPDYYNYNFEYLLRYVKRPRPILLADFYNVFGENISINGYIGHGSSTSGIDDDIVIEDNTTPCELDPILHEEILQRAVELAQVAQGDNRIQLNTSAGARSE